MMALSNPFIWEIAQNKKRRTLFTFLKGDYLLSILTLTVKSNLNWGSTEGQRCDSTSSFHWSSSFSGFNRFGVEQNFDHNSDAKWGAMGASIMI